MYEKLIEMSRHDYYKTGNLLDYWYHQKYYKIIGISLSRDFSRQKNMSSPLPISFVGKLKEEIGATTFFYRWKALKNNSKFFFIFVNCNRII